jgi:hypothetical protein
LKEVYQAKTKDQRDSARKNVFVENSGLNEKLNALEPLTEPLTKPLTEPLFTAAQAADPVLGPMILMNGQEL